LKKNIKDIIDYLLVIFIVLISGAVIMYQPDSSIGKNILYVMPLLMVFKLSINRNFNKRIIVITLMLIVLIHIGMVLNKDYENYSYHISLILRILLAFFTVNYLKFLDFKEKYVKIMFILAIMSLIFYVIGISPIGRKFIIKLPIIFNDVGTKYNHFYVYGYQNGIIGRFRNASIFWEPGAYQAFLNLALLFSYEKKNKKEMYTYILAILTTFSTTGYLIMFIILLKDVSMKKMVVFVLIFIFCFPVISDVVINKFKSGNQSGDRRKVDLIVDLLIFKKSVIIGNGYKIYNNEKKERIEKYDIIEKQGGSTNSITINLAIYGILVISIFIYGFVKVAFHNSPSNRMKIIGILYFVLALSSQGLMFKPLYIILSYYGFKKGKRNEKRHKC
jgi:hypothetical protein